MWSLERLPVQKSNIRGHEICPPESGGQRDREADPTSGKGGWFQSRILVGLRLWNHPGASRHPS